MLLGELPPNAEELMMAEQHRMIAEAENKRIVNLEKEKNKEEKLKTGKILENNKVKSSKEIKNKACYNSMY